MPKRPRDLSKNANETGDSSPTNRGFCTKHETSLKGESRVAESLTVVIVNDSCDDEAEEVAVDSLLDLD